MYTFDVLSLHYSCYSICIFFSIFTKNQYSLHVSVSAILLPCVLYWGGSESKNFTVSSDVPLLPLLQKKIPQNQNLQFSRARQSWAAEVWTAGRWWFTVLYSGTRDSYHGCAANKSAARLWSCDVNMNQTLWGMIPAPCWIYAMKN